MIATDTELRVKGMDTLLNNLGDVEAEKFIALIIREKFDYTKWHSDLWQNQNIENISEAAMQYQERLAR